MPADRDADIPVLLVCSVAFVVIFVVWERRLERIGDVAPVIKYSLFKRSNYRISALLFCVFLIMLSALTWVYASTIWYQNYKGLSAWQNGLYILPCSVVGVLVAVSTVPAGFRDWNDC